MREWLIELRTSAHLSQGKVAKESKISRQYYSFIETEKRGKKLPVSTAQRIATVLNFDWRFFYEDDTELIKTKRS